MLVKFSDQMGILCTTLLINLKLYKRDDFLEN